MTVKIELFTADFCPYCAHAKEALETAIADLGPDRFELCVLDVVQEIDHAVALGVLATPAIAIDGKLAGVASPTARRLKTMLQGYLHSNVGESNGAIPNR